MSVSYCLKRFPLVSFPRYYASAAAARSTKTVSSDPASTGEHAKPKRRSKKPPAEPKPPPPILESPKIQSHLEKLAETNGQIGRNDLEVYRPPHHVLTDAPDYRESYLALQKKITGAFTVTQLHQFMDMYNLPRKKLKTDCAIAIMEEWGWTSLSTIVQRERELEMIDARIPLTPHQAFLILGIDGADSQSLSIKYRVKLSFERAEGPGNHFELKGTGQGGPIKQLREHIDTLKTAINEEVFISPIGEPLQVDVLRRISRLSGALAENFGREQVRVSYNGANPRSAVVARRLVARAAREGPDADQTTLLLHLPPSVPSSSRVPESHNFPYTYSMYPFSSPRSLPWTVSPGGVFRLRRVEQWLGTGASEDLIKTGGLAMGRGRVLTLKQQDADLRRLLQAPLPHSPSFSSRVVQASIGHILLTSSAARGNIDPPLKGYWKLPHIMNWIEKRSQPNVFNPTLPAVLLNSHSAQYRMLHRLVYRTMQAAVDVPDIIKVEFVLPRSVGEPSDEGSDLVEPDSHPSCWLGQNSNLDVMMPDRAADIRFSIFDSDLLPAHQWPSTLKLDEYVHDFREYSSTSPHDRDVSRRPEPPLIVTHNDIDYILHTSSTVRQNVEETGSGDSSYVKVVTESILDLEVAQKSASCQVLCNDIGSDACWQSFLHQCDTMSSCTYSVTFPNYSPILLQ